ncbi:MAG: 30S ribosomal protein S17e [Candidatus Aenigmatarchaeota archaeon]|nr:MAG: 30S ribosomal protein S17e [Candidatus Aenigmarchaeota archaeon]
MGRIKNTAIKTLGSELIMKYGDKFSTDFVKNKEVLKEIIDIKSKRIRNILAGYIAKEMKRIEKTGI